MKRIAVICARKGSKGVAGKNWRLLAGKPLIKHTIEHAIEAEIFDAIAVSSDSPEILEFIKQWENIIAIERPAKLATDAAGKVPAIGHCVTETEHRTGIEFDTVVDLDVTAPLRQVEQIREAVRLFELSDADNMLSGSLSRKSPYFNIVERDENNRIKLSKPQSHSVLSRQASPSCFDLNGAIYIWRRDILSSNPETAMGPNTILYEMSEHTGIDIDTPTDFSFAEFLLAQRS